MLLGPKQNNCWDLQSYDAMRSVTIPFHSKDSQTNTQEHRQRLGDARVLPQAAASSGKQRLHLLRQSVEDALWVLVPTGGIHHGSVHLTVRPAD